MVATVANAFALSEASNMPAMLQLRIAGWQYVTTGTDEQVLVAILIRIKEQDGCVFRSFIRIKCGLLAFGKTAIGFLDV